MLQMADEKGLPVGVITDEPRFAYRGFMMDVSRHFFNKEFIKKQMDALAYYKLNRTHTNGLASHELGPGPGPLMDFQSSR